MAIEIHTFDEHGIFLDAAQKLLVEHLSMASAAPHGVILAGGSTPLPAYKAIAESPPKIDEDLHILFSDERMVPEDSSDSNYANMRPMIEGLGIPPDHVLRVATELSLEKATEKYDKDLRGFIEKGGVITLAVLGLGSDGHTASLFSVEAARAGGDHCAIPAPKESGPDRVSMTSSFLNRAERIVFWVAGADKADIVAQIQNEPEALPAGVAVQHAQSVELWFSPNK